ncbi:LysO family transporter [Paramaledivibacter caminithermalis]|uniref:Lysine exporter LysO n=1 Tax=Paramaledivibacter caminithermalis (strain DSM 15212 / CIP 107654 / DViRD3) TaxID=1121301 RepID=A0A1M6JSK7_PARC5|nr:LysO family transporter [Paramaledivibacter caminithermalis]SHJ49678.1 Membrane protein of unknown function [Paramaledivibacter caminithermalis DSM 15212]
MRILLYIAIISLGALFGYKNLVSQKIFDKMNIIQYVCLLFLLFVMGVKIGINKDVLMSFHKLGFSAVVIAAFSVAFSVLAVKIISNFIKTESKVE